MYAVFMSLPFIFAVFKCDIPLILLLYFSERNEKQWKPFAF